MSRFKASLALSCFMASLARPVRLPDGNMAAQELWGCSEAAIAARLKLSPKERGTLSSFRRGFSAVLFQSELKERGVGSITLGDDLYPEGLTRLYDPPLVLYMLAFNKQAPEKLLSRRSIAVVGARAASRYGLDVATMLAKQLSRQSVCVTSGMAMGVDAAAHWGALDEKGQTVAVLGCGVDVVYPKSNSDLYRRILGDGMVISEYPPGIKPRPWRFPARNRIIAALSDGVVVVEAKKKSGALITADFCLEAGGQVFAVPGSIFSELSAGTNKLINEGAIALMGVDQVFEDLGIEVRTREIKEESGHSKANEKLTGTEKSILKALDGVCRHQDILAARAGLDSREAASALIGLELKGLIRHEPGAGYSR